MKKALLLFASAALLFAGCQKEQIASGETDGDPVTVTFTAGLTPEGTKAVLDNDGHAANVNHWVLEVRDAQDDLFYEEERDVAAGTLQQTYKLKLFKNQSYTLQFWADTKGAYDTDDLTAVSAKDAVANKDSRDAFSANVDYTSLVSESKDVTLTRPFAQLNIITCDLDELQGQVKAETYAKYAPTSLTVTASVPTTFNVKTQAAGTASSQTLTATASYADFLAGAPETTLFMDYIFASAEEADIVAINFSSQSEKNSISYDFPVIPLQRNYRTNIKGNLMSNDSEWTVTIDPEWETPEYVEEQWSAGMVTPVTPVEDVYTINLPSELAWIAQQVNNGNTFEGKTVKLAKDINLNNGAWTPIGKSDVLSFKGTFEGNGKTIKNLNVNLGNSSVNAGLFSFVNSGTVKNFTIDGAKVSVVGGAAGVVAGKMFPGGLIEGVTVKNAELTGCRQMGGIVGSIYGKVKNCTAENVKITATPNLVGGSYDNGDKCGAIVGFSTFDNNSGEISGNVAKNVVIKGYRDIGGIVGAADCSNTAINGNEVHGAELTADQTVNFYGKKDYNVGAIVGRVNAGTVDASNTAENVVISPYVIDASGNYHVATKSGLFTIAAEINSALASFYGKTIFIEKDIDLENEDWTPIQGSPSGDYTITFDGQGHKISNMKVSEIPEDGGAGFFGHWAGTITNLELDGVRIEDTINWSGALCGYFSTGTISNVTVSNVSITNLNETKCKRIGGLCGFVDDGTDFSNVALNGVAITGTEQLGGFIGSLQNQNSTYNFTNCSISDVSIYKVGTKEVNSFGSKVGGRAAGAVINGDITVSGTNTLPDGAPEDGWGTVGL